MTWFRKSTPEPEWTEPERVRLASAEFVSGLVEIAEIYERREKGARAQVVAIAERLSQAEYFNYGALDRALDEINNRAAASEIRDWVRSYEYQGRRPPYMPPLPPSAEKPNEDGS